MDTKEILSFLEEQKVRYLHDGQHRLFFQIDASTIDQLEEIGKKINKIIDSYIIDGKVYGTIACNLYDYLSAINLELPAQYFMKIQYDSKMDKFILNGYIGKEKKELFLANFDSLCRFKSWFGNHFTYRNITDVQGKITWSLSDRKNTKLAFYREFKKHCNENKIPLRYNNMTDRVEIDVLTLTQKQLIALHKYLISDSELLNIYLNENGFDLYANSCLNGKMWEKEMFFTFGVKSNYSFIFKEDVSIDAKLAHEIIFEGTESNNLSLTHTLDGVEITKREFEYIGGVFDFVDTVSHSQRLLKIEFSFKE